MEQGLYKAKAHQPASGNQFQCGDIHAVATNLTIADNAIPGELKPCDAILCDAHLIARI